MATKAAKKTVTPAPAEAPAKAPSRTALLATLKEKGYTGPTSFTASVLREVVAWVEAGSPKEATVPTGALYSVHPDLKPAPKPKAARLSKWQQGYQEALTDIDNCGDDLDKIKQWVKDNRAQAVA